MRFEDFGDGQMDWVSGDTALVERSHTNASLHTHHAVQQRRTISEPHSLR